LAGRAIGRPEGRILEALGLFDQLTAEQLSRHLDYQFRYTQHKCKGLADGKDLQRLTLPKRMQAGSVPYVYTLGRSGRDYISSLGENATPQVKKRYRPSEQRASYHTLAINEILLQVRKITETDPALTLRHFISEREFQQDPITVTLPKIDGGKSVSLIPDLWLYVRQRVGGKAYSLGICIEVNLTPIEQRRWRRKISMYLNCFEGCYTRVGTKALQVVTFIASPSLVLRKGSGGLSDREQKERNLALREAEKRKSDYLLWTEKELASQNKREESDLFLFSAAPLDTLTPKELVYSKHFVSPFENAPTTLLLTE